MEYVAAEGVCKQLVHRFGGTGSSVVEPYFDPTTSIGATAAVEGTDLSITASINSTRRSYSAAEWAAYTFATYDSIDESTEATKQYHTHAHGYSQAVKLEKKIIATFASFTTLKVTATSTSGLNWGTIAAARTLLEGGTTPAPKPYSFVCHPNQWFYFAKNAAFNQNTTYGLGPTALSDTVQRKYLVASLVGEVNVFQSAHIAVNATSYGLMFSKDAIGLFVPRDMTLKMDEDISKRGYEIVSTLKSGARARVLGYGCLVKALATAPSAT
jgi:hypothetical protein